MHKKKGITLAELLITVVILAALASVTIPGFSKSKAKAEANQAIAFLRTIRTAERMYFGKNGVYAGVAATCATDVPSTCCGNATQIKAVLGAEVAMTNIYTFDVAATPTTFFARARKGSTAPANCSPDLDMICLSEAGVWSGTSSYVPTVADN